MTTIFSNEFVKFNIINTQQINTEQKNDNTHNEINYDILKSETPIIQDDNEEDNENDELNVITKDLILFLKSNIETIQNITIPNIESIKNEETSIILSEEKNNFEIKLIPTNQEQINYDNMTCNFTTYNETKPIIFNKTPILEEDYEDDDDEISYKNEKNYKKKMADHLDDLLFRHLNGENIEIENNLKKTNKIINKKKESNVKEGLSLFINKCIMNSTLNYDMKTQFYNINITKLEKNIKEFNLSFYKNGIHPFSVIYNEGIKWFEISCFGKIPVSSKDKILILCQSKLKEFSKIKKEHHNFSLRAIKMIFQLNEIITDFYCIAKITKK